MDISIRKQFCSGLKVVLFLAVTLFFSTARAQFPMFPPAPYEIYPPTAPEFIVGGYTVDWQDTSGSICWLSERVNNGSWAAVPNTYSPTKTITLSRSVGNYDYQVACIDDYGGVLGPISSVGVVSSMPTLDPLDVQLGYSFQVRTGHFNGDGKKDIYIKRTGGHADNGVIYKTILTQNNDGNFDVVENPTSGQLSNAAGWPVSSGVDAVVNDFNVDGRVDVILKNLNSVITGIDDQIVYSAGKFFKGSAQAATAMDFEFEKFFRDTYSWILDPNYFAQAITSNMPAYNLSLDVGVYFCSYWFGFPTCLNVFHDVFNQTVTLAMLGLSGYETIAAAEEGLADALGFASYDTFKCVLICGWIEFYGFYSSTVFTFHDTWTPTTESPGFDDINFSAKARDLADISDNIGNGSVIEEVKDIFEEVLGGLADIVLKGEGLGEIIVFDDSHSTNDYEEDKKMTLSLMRIIDAKTDRPATPKVELRSRIPLGFLPTAIQGNRSHLSVHSPTSVLLSWHSGFPSESFGTAFGPGGLLLSEERYLPDARGLNNMLVGYADSSIIPDIQAFWSALNSAASAYGDNLTYCLFPELNESLFGTCVGYNSNSYAVGLLYSRGGSIFPLTLGFGIVHPLTDSNFYPGVQKPVPSNNF